MKKYITVGGNVENRSMTDREPKYGDGKMRDQRIDDKKTAERERVDVEGADKAGSSEVCAVQACASEASAKKGTSANEAITSDTDKDGAVTNGAGLTEDGAKDVGLTEDGMIGERFRLTSPADISKIMKRYGFAFSKSLGQNFLIDSHAVDSIIDAVEKCVMRSAEGTLREGDSPESSLLESSLPESSLPESSFPKGSFPKDSLPESGSAESKSAEGKSAESKSAESSFPEGGPAEGVSAGGGSVAGGGRLGDVLIIEIGPGFGVLTERLCEMGARMGTKVVAIEKDKSLPPILRELVPAPNLEIIEGDVLACDLDTVIRGAGCERAVVVANLPYYITTPIIMKVLEDAKRVDALVVMMQKEVAERILDRGDRGAITMTAGYYAESRQVAGIKRNSFMPAPKVDSAVLSMTRIPPRLGKAEERMYMRLVRAIYSSRRKTLTNSLNSLNLCDKKSLSDVIIEIGYSPNLRGETLGIEDLLVLSKKFTALEER